MTTTHALKQTADFVVEFLEGDSQCIASTAKIFNADIELVKKLIEVESFEPHFEFELTQDDVQRLVDNKLIPQSPSTLPARIRWKIPLDDLSYPIHTGRELKLMLENKKPLSSFSEIRPINQPSTIAHEAIFDRYVSEGVIKKYEKSVPHDAGNAMLYRRVIYAITGEEWRVDVYFQIWKVAEKTGWNESLERLEGYLLGYTDQQCDEFIAHQKEGRMQG